jgi:uncharacterized membrane protein
MDYTTIQPNKELKACSRQQLKGVWLSMALAFLVYTLILSGPYFISSFIDAWEALSDIWDGSSWDIGDYENEPASPVTMILYLGIFIVNGAFMLGLAGYFLKRIRGEEIALKNIFDGFKRFWTAFLLSFFTFLFVMLWSLLLLIPGIIKAFSYSMAVYILHDNPGMSSLEAIKKSKIMMKGYKGKLFLLELSFIGWIMLGALSFGIGLLWVYPYMYLSIANFYENLKRTQEKALLDDNSSKDKPGGTAEEEKLEIARRMKSNGRPLSEIVEDTGLSLEIVENL